MIPPSFVLFYIVIAFRWIVNSKLRAPLNILRSRSCGSYFRHTSQKSPEIHQGFRAAFVSPDEKIPRSSARAELLEMPLIKKFGRKDAFSCVVF